MIHIELFENFLSGKNGAEALEKKFLEWNSLEKRILEWLLEQDYMETTTTEDVKKQFHAEKNVEESLDALVKTQMVARFEDGALLPTRKGFELVGHGRGTKG